MFSKSIAALVLFQCTLFALGEEKYTSKYDNINFDEILHSDRLLRNYVNCLLDKGPCTPDGKELKSKFDHFSIKMKVCFYSIYC